MSDASGEAARRRLQYRSTISATTEILGGSPQHAVEDDVKQCEECNMPMIEYVFGGSGDDQKDRLLHWIRVRGPVPPGVDAEGYLEPVSSIWRLIRSKESASEDLMKYQHEYDQQKDEVETAKNHMMNKLKSSIHGPDAFPKAVEQMEIWGNKKLHSRFQLVQEAKKTIDSLELETQKSLQDILYMMQVQSNKYVAELDDMFANMSLVESVAQTSPPTVEAPETTPMDLSDAGLELVGVGNKPAGHAPMDVASVALSHVHALEDGPSKTALLAVLETAIVTPKQAG